MKLNRIALALAPSLLALIGACADGQPIDADVPAETDETAPVSPTALAIERAERMLDRGENAAEARRILLEALSAPEITVDERSAAKLALSRAHEALGDDEAAIAVIEDELGARAEDHEWSNKDFRDRLRELLTGSAEAQGLDPVYKSEALPFTRLLTRYFPVSDDSKATINFYVFGGERRLGELETWDVASAIRAEQEEACPLCNTDLNIGSHRSGSDWLMIPSFASHFNDALVVFYYDLGKNRIPARYERYLPMKVADIERELSAGKSFVAGMERPGSPPVLLIAAPRTALLGDVEEQLGRMTHLPKELEYVDVKLNLRPEEIQAEIRAHYFPIARACYESLLERDAHASGKVMLKLEVAGDGAVNHSEVKPEGDLHEQGFESCMLAGVAKLSFDASGQKVTIGYPIVFTPN